MQCVDSMVPRYNKVSGIKNITFVFCLRGYNLQFQIDPPPPPNSTPISLDMVILIVCTMWHDTDSVLFVTVFDKAQHMGSMHYRKSGNFRWKNIFVVGGGYEN